MLWSSLQGSLAVRPKIDVRADTFLGNLLASGIDEVHGQAVCLPLGQICDGAFTGQGSQSVAETKPDRHT